MTMELKMKSELRHVFNLDPDQIDVHTVDGVVTIRVDVQAGDFLIEGVSDEGARVLAVRNHAEDGRWERYSDFSKPQQLHVECPPATNIKVGEEAEIEAIPFVASRYEGTRFDRYYLRGVVVKKPEPDVATMEVHHVLVGNEVEGIGRIVAHLKSTTPEGS